MFLAENERFEGLHRDLSRRGDGLRSGAEGRDEVRGLDRVRRERVWVKRTSALL